MGLYAAAREIVAAFFTTLPLVQAELDASLLGVELTAIQAAAHKMKGMLLTLGARRAGEMAAQVESASRAGPIERAREQVDALTAEVKRFAEHASRRIEGGPGDQAPRCET